MFTLHTETLVVASAFPDPPFELVEDESSTGFDIDMMQAVSGELGLKLQRIAYSGADFDGIFNGLAQKQYDAVSSGTTITPDRSKTVLFSNPYLEFNQGVAINREVTPHVASPADLHGLTAGIQSGNTSEFVAQRWHAQGLIAGIRYYPYDGISHALDDLKAGHIGVVIKLFPVISWLIRNSPQLSIAFQVPTHEQLGIAVAKDNSELCNAINAALHALQSNGKLAQLRGVWSLNHFTS